MTFLRLTRLEDNKEIIICADGIDSIEKVENGTLIVDEARRKGVIYKESTEDIEAILKKDDFIFLSILDLKYEKRLEVSLYDGVDTIDVINAIERLKGIKSVDVKDRFID